MTAAITATGECALFKINDTGDTCMFIPDVVAGLVSGDVVVRMTGITDVKTINITAGDVLILT